MLLRREDGIVTMRGRTVLPTFWFDSSLVAAGRLELGGFWDSVEVAVAFSRFGGVLDSRVFLVGSFFWEERGVRGIFF